MTPLAFRQTLARLRISQQEAARRLGLNDRTVRRYASGDSLIPQPIVLALRALAQQEQSQ